MLFRSLDEAIEAAGRIGFPLIVRPSFTLGGTGGGVAYNREELRQLAAAGIDLSMTSEIMLERSLLGWKEMELEVMRDRKDNVIIVCSIENMDPMGVHTGDSITGPSMKSVSQLGDLTGKRVVVRCDFNVPLDGHIEDRKSVV